MAIMYSKSLKIRKLFSSLSLIKRSSATQLSPQIKPPVDQENFVVSSPFPDLKIPEAHLSKYVWENAFASKTVQYRYESMTTATKRTLIENVQEDYFLFVSGLLL